MMAGHDLLIYMHITFMGLWLGSDFGVYLMANQIANPRLPLSERLNLLQLALKLDMIPRTMLILMLPLGVHLGVNLGIFLVSNIALFSIWFASLLWLAITWLVFLLEKKKAGQYLRMIDLSIRYILFVYLMVYGLKGFLQVDTNPAIWLSVKFMLFSLIIFMGLLLRIQVTKWVKGFQILGQDPHSEEAEMIISSTRKITARQAQILWGLILLCGFLGVTKAI